MLALLNSDRAAMRKALSGNPGAFRLLVDRYAGVVHGVALARLKNTADAEDVTQETFIRFYQHLDRMASHRHVGPWLVRVARNACADIIRNRMRHSGQPLAAKEQARVPDPVREEIHQILWQQIERLDEEAREVLVLRYFMKKKAREIAALLEITPHAAAKRLQRARDELGRRLTDALGDEIDEVKASQNRTERIMAAVLAVPTAWKASAAGATAAATAAGIATGAGAAKLAAAVAVIAAVCIVGYLGYDRYSRPYDAQDITESSSFEVVEEAAAPDNTPAPAEDKLAGTADQKMSAPDARTTTAESAYPPLYASVRGRVTYEDGRPAAGASVTVDNQEDVEQYARSKAAGFEGLDPVAPLSYTASTDSTGWYRLSGVHLAATDQTPPRYRMFAELGDLYGEVANPSFRHLRRQMTFDFILSPSASLGGVVTDLQGKPIARAFVATRDQQAPRGDHRSRATWTEEDGSFLLEHLLPGSSRLYLSARGYLNTTTDFLRVGTTKNAIRLDPGNWISGRVVNRDTGEGVGEVEIFGFQESWLKATGSEQQNTVPKSIGGDTDSLGNFKITGCEPGIYILGILAKRGRKLPLTLIEPSPVTITDKPLTGVVLEATAGAVLRGVVYDDETGARAAGKAFINCSNDTQTGGRYCMLDDQGAYELLGLPWGEVSIGVYVNDRKRYDGKVTLQPGDPIKTFDIHLPAREFFGGTVIDETGATVPGASVFAMTPEDRLEIGNAVTDYSGAFKLFIDRKDPPSILYFQAMNEAAYSAPEGPRNFASHDKDTVLRMASAGRLEGEAVSQSGSPIGEAVVAALPDDESQLFLYRSSGHRALDVNQRHSVNALVQSNGAFAFEKLAVGRYTLQVYPFASVAASPVATAEVTIQPGRTVRARLVVGTSGFGSIEGTVLLDGAPFAGQLVILEPVGQEWVCDVMAYTDPDGHYQVRTILPGEVEVKLDSTFGSDRKFEQKQTVQIISGEVARVDFDIAAGRGAAEGYAYYEGRPAANVGVVFEPAENTGAGGPSARTDEQGMYKVQDLVEGPYLVTATLTDYGTWPANELTQTVEVEITAGNPLRIDFDFIGGEIAGILAGLNPGEKALVGVFPPDAALAEWSVEALEALGERMIRSTIVEQNGPFSFASVQEGEYILGAVTLPASADTDTEAMLQGRFAVGPPFRVIPGATTETALTFEK